MFNYAFSPTVFLISAQNLGRAMDWVFSGMYIEKKPKSENVNSDASANLTYLC